MADGDAVEMLGDVQTMQCTEDKGAEPFFAYRDQKVVAVRGHTKNSSSSDENNSSNDSDGSGSGDGLWKRRRRRSPPAPRPSAPAPPQTNCRRNNIWGQVLAEQSLTEDIRGFCGVQASLKCNERAVESYRYWRDHQSVPKRTPVVPGNRRKRKAVVGLEETDDSVADRIAQALEEPKRMLIGQVVTVVGRDKALELLENTQDIEANGGMPTLNGSRRRTPGGVFFQLLKSDPEIAEEQVEAIFEEDRKFIEQIKKRRKAVKRKEKSEKLKAMMKDQAEDEMPLAPLPTAAELALSQCKPDMDELEPGEIVDDDDNSLPDRTPVPMD